jgi:hypothetical protein
MNDIPAFPLHNHGTQTLGMHFTGMTLRDYFAAKAIQGLLASDVHDSMKTFATKAYEMADLMMETRNAA